MTKINCCASCACSDPSLKEYISDEHNSSIWIHEDCFRDDCKIDPDLEFQWKKKDV